MNEETTTILIDTALAAGSATALDPEERALQELVLHVRADAPTPADDFRLRMDARVAAGFPPRRARRMRMPAFALRRPRLAALGVAASLLAALIVAGSLSGRGTQSRDFGPASSGGGSSLETPAVAPAGGSAAQSAPATPSAGAAPELQAKKKRARGVAGGASSDSVASSTGSIPSPVIGIVPVPPVGGGTVRGGRPRRVERSAALTLAAPKEKLNDVGDQIIAVTDRYRGIVMRSSITSATDQGASGSFDLRIPQGNLRPALRDLSALADVQSRTENADDVTASFVNARTRLQELNAERTSLLKRLAKAKTDAEAQALRSQIRLVNAELDAQTRSLRNLRRNTSYATVSVSLVAKQGGSGGGTGIGNGARDLRDSLIDSANLALRVLGVAIPIAILVALLWAGNAWATRRRREAALDSRA